MESNQTAKLDKVTEDVLKVIEEWRCAMVTAVISIL